MLPPLSPSAVRGVIFPVYRRLRRDRLFTVLDGLEGNQWLAHEELRALQWNRLKDFLSQPAKKRPGAKTFGYQRTRTAPTPVPKSEAQPTEEKSE